MLSQCRISDSGGLRVNLLSKQQVDIPLFTFSHKETLCFINLKNCRFYMNKIDAGLAEIEFLSVIV